MNIRCSLDTSPETLRDQLKSAILQTSEEVLGITTKKNKDWFNENNQEIQKLPAKKRSSHKAHLTLLSCPVRKAAFHLICSILQCKLREIQLFRLEVSLKKTEVLLQPAPLEKYHPRHITISGTELKAVHQFTYQGCTITSDVKIDREVDYRLVMANSAFGRLYKRVWNNKHLKKGTKISVYWAVVLTTLLYDSESWITNHHHLWLLECFHQCCLRIILNIHSSNYVSNVEVLDQVEITSIKAMLLNSQLRWAGYVFRMGGHPPPKIALYGELSTDYHNKRGTKEMF